MSLEVELKKIRLILLEDGLALLLGLGNSGLSWMFSEPDLLQRVFNVPSAKTEYEIFTVHGREHFFCIESFGVNFRCVNLFQFLNVYDQDVSFPDSDRVQRISNGIFLAGLLDRSEAVAKGL